MANQDKQDVPDPHAESEREAKRAVRMITAKDAGWVTPTAFVLPVKFVPVDPPRRIKKTPPAAD